MSVDAGLYLRWREGTAPARGELARLIGLAETEDPQGWLKGVGPDGCVMWVLISDDSSDRLGPFPNPGAVPGQFSEHSYDYWLHVSPSKSEPYAEDLAASLRAYCREIIHLVRSPDFVEAAHDVDRDGLVSYWTAAGQALGPGLPQEIEVEVWWAAESRETVDDPDLRDVLVPGLGLVGDNVAKARIVQPVRATDSVSETIGIRAAELKYHRMARFSGRDVATTVVDALSTRLVTELVRPGRSVDVAVWANGSLCRYEVAAQPPESLRVFSG